CQAATSTRNDSMGQNRGTNQCSAWGQVWHNLSVGDHHSSRNKEIPDATARLVGGLVCGFQRDAKMRRTRICAVWTRSYEVQSRISRPVRDDSTWSGRRVGAGPTNAMGRGVLGGAEHPRRGAL